MAAPGHAGIRLRAAMQEQGRLAALGPVRSKLSRNFRALPLLTRYLAEFRTRGNPGSEAEFGILGSACPRRRYPAPWRSDLFARAIALPLVAPVVAAVDHVHSVAPDRDRFVPEAVPANPLDGLEYAGEFHGIVRGFDKARLGGFSAVSIDRNSPAAGSGVRLRGAIAEDVQPTRKVALYGNFSPASLLSRALRYPSGCSTYCRHLPGACFFFDPLLPTGSTTASASCPGPEAGTSRSCR